MIDIFEQAAFYIKQRIDVSQSEMEIILSNFRPYKARKNEILIHQGQVGQRTFFVGKGCLRIFFNNEQGQHTTRYIAFENNFATALVSFITGEPSQEFIQVIENSDLLYINQADFYHLLNIIPAWDTFYRIYLEKAYVNNTNRLMSFVTMDATERYRQLLDQNPAIVMRLPNKLVASYLNISQETLSRLKARI